jgi:CTP synthase
MILKKLSIRGKKQNLKEWDRMVGKVKASQKPVRIAMVGKYQKTGDYTLEDSYVCVIEALKHAGKEFGVRPELVWINSEDLEKLNDKKMAEKFKGVDGICVPQGWGRRGVEGKIKAAKYARENNVPYLGLCFGMQMATIEFARNVLGMKGANTSEANPNTKYPVIHVIEDQKKHLAQRAYGGTIRLGAWPCVVKRGSKLEKMYKKYGGGKKSAWYLPNPAMKTKRGGKNVIHERHRHRYEFNIKYRKRFEKAGFIISGISPDRTLVEAIELRDHHFFVGTQFHPEYLSRPLSPHPIFMSFVEAISK